MIGILRAFARAYSSYRRRRAGTIEQTNRSRDSRTAPVPRSPVNPVATRQATVVDRAVARRVRCLSEPCANTRLAIALLRARRQSRTRDVGMLR